MRKNMYVAHFGAFLEVAFTVYCFVIVTTISAVKR